MSSTSLGYCPPELTGFVIDVILCKPPVRPVEKSSTSLIFRANLSFISNSRILPPCILRIEDCKPCGLSLFINVSYLTVTFRSRSRTSLNSGTRLPIKLTFSDCDNYSTYNINLCSIFFLIS